MDGRRRGRAGAALSTSRQEVRAAARQRRARRGTAISVLSSVVVLGGLAALVLTSPGWDDVRQTFFSWSDFKDSFPDVLKGFWLDVKLFVIVEVVVLILGLFIALVRTTRSPALFPFRLIAAVYSDIFRGIPTILMVYLVGFGVLALNLNGVPTDPLVLGGAALAVAYSAYVAEVFRSGIDSVHPTQMAGALALGLTRVQALRHVVVPQAVRRVVPPLLNDFIALQKDVALVSILGPAEAFRVAQIEASSNFVYTPLVAAAVLYLCVTIPMARYVDHIQNRKRRERGGEVAL
ncbi:MAG TPA: amino acid ABC transporter permease [Baekduia sp.]|uniref:amino acid ABC transporter permease n=1 Tax=Baekduia sp. TaxID=2600305 RepID=UPI002CE3981B|nr:amino acid ABC transporter permease [Baekduia sp.]HMJ36891.1 amino acid ABC transporter permease [Baekduia sp.]